MTSQAFGSLLADFLYDSRERTSRVEEIFIEMEEADRKSRRELMVEARRELHTLKGNSGMMGLKELQGLAHRLEDEIDRLQQGGENSQEILEELDRFRAMLDETGEQGGSGEADSGEGGAGTHPGEPGRKLLPGSVRVPFEALDELMDLLAEMVIFRNRLADTVSRGKAAASANAWEEVDGAHEALGKTLNFIQDRVMRLRMVPLGTLFGQLRRIVHDESRNLGKEVHFETSGGDKPMDKALLEVASEALGHLVRNAVVHGIERPEDRGRALKPRRGTVRLSAVVHANAVQIDVEDDGGGIDKDKLLASALSRGVDPAGCDDPTSLLFVPGVSTASGADMGSGRGMGLTAALESVQRLGGRIEVTSQRGLGSCFRIHLPLSVSITRCLILKADREEYALPLSSVVESLRFQAGEGHRINHAGVLAWRDKVIPTVDIGYAFGSTAAPRAAGYLVIIESEGKHRGLVVDDITGIREIVVKGLDPVVGAPQGIQGATILGDGRVILILDQSGLSGLKPFFRDGQEDTVESVEADEELRWPAAPGRPRGTSAAGGEDR